MGSRLGCYLFWEAIHQLLCRPSEGLQANANANASSSRAESKRSLLGRRAWRISGSPPVHSGSASRENPAPVSLSVALKHTPAHPLPHSSLIDNFCRSSNIKATVIRTAQPTIYLFVRTRLQDESGWRWHCYEANGVRGVHSGTTHPEIGLQKGRGGGEGWCGVGEGGKWGGGERKSDKRWGLGPCCQPIHPGVDRYITAI